MEMQIPPTYNLTLIANEDPDPLTSRTEKPEEKSQLSITCTRDEAFQSSEFTLKKNNKEIGMKDSKGRKITLYIHEYGSSHDGMYVCESKRNDGSYHYRQLRLASKSKIPRNTKYCSEDFADYCGINGVCALHNGRPTCYCHKDYEGPACERMIVSDLNNTSYSTGSTGHSHGSEKTYGYIFLLLIIVIIGQALFSFYKKKSKKDVQFGTTFTSDLIKTNNAQPSLPSSAQNKFYNVPSSIVSRNVNPDAPGRDIRRNDDIRKNVFKKDKANFDELMDQKQRLVKEDETQSIA